MPYMFASFNSKECRLIHGRHPGTMASHQHSHPNGKAARSANRSIDAGNARYHQAAEAEARAEVANVEHRARMNLKRIAAQRSPNIENLKGWRWYKQCERALKEAEVSGDPERFMQACALLLMATTALAAAGCGGDVDLDDGADLDADGNDPVPDPPAPAARNTLTGSPFTAQVQPPVTSPFVPSTPDDNSGNNNASREDPSLVEVEVQPETQEPAEPNIVGANGKSEGPIIPVGFKKVETGPVYVEVSDAQVQKALRQIEGLDLMKNLNSGNLRQGLNTLHDYANSADFDDAYKKALYQSMVTACLRANDPAKAAAELQRCQGAEGNEGALRFTPEDLASIAENIVTHLKGQATTVEGLQNMVKHLQVLEKAGFVTPDNAQAAVQGQRDAVLQIVRTSVQKSTDIAGVQKNLEQLVEMKLLDADALLQELYTAVISIPETRENRTPFARKHRVLLYCNIATRLARGNMIPEAENLTVRSDGQYRYLSTSLKGSVRGQMNTAKEVVAAEKKRSTAEAILKDASSTEQQQQNARRDLAEYYLNNGEVKPEYFQDSSHPLAPYFATLPANKSSVDQCSFWHFVEIFAANLQDPAKTALQQYARTFLHRAIRENDGTLNNGKLLTAKNEAKKHPLIGGGVNVEEKVQVTKKPVKVDGREEIKEALMVADQKAGEWIDVSDRFTEGNGWKLNENGSITYTGAKDKSQFLLPIDLKGVGAYEIAIEAEFDSGSKHMNIAFPIGEDGYAQLYSGNKKRTMTGLANIDGKTVEKNAAHRVIHKPIPDDVPVRYVIQVVNGKDGSVQVSSSATSVGGTISPRQFMGHKDRFSVAEDWQPKGRSVGVGMFQGGITVRNVKVRKLVP